MRNIAGLFMAAGNIHWQTMDMPKKDGEEEGISINFRFHKNYKQHECYIAISNSLIKNNVEWLRWDKKYWILSADIIKEHFSFLAKEDWLFGDLAVTPEIKYAWKETHIRFEITSNDVKEQMMTRIFLSHKGVDKQLVRRFKSALVSLNYSPWLDEDDMNAGDELERTLLKGFSDSCAAVFFITPNYIDEGYLATEINYALLEKRNKGDKFSIITLNLTNEDGSLGEIPGLLRQYVWKEPKSDIEALTEIVKALPIESPLPVWRNNA